MINSGLTLQKHSPPQKQGSEKDAYSPLLFSTASVKSKKYGYRKDTLFLLFSGDVTMFLKKKKIQEKSLKTY